MIISRIKTTFITHKYQSTHLIIRMHFAFTFYLGPPSSYCYLHLLGDDYVIRGTAGGT